LQKSFNLQHYARVFIPQLAFIFRAELFKVASPQLKHRNFIFLTFMLQTLFCKVEIYIEVPLKGKEAPNLLCSY